MVTNMLIGEERNGWCWECFDDRASDRPDGRHCVCCDAHFTGESECCADCEKEEE